ncbi:glutathione peroxidase [Halarcobacter anaerophilus]|jgi:glutathione peroxidase|uniref:Glutathione peroxidase n=1 Tax=Halarcobacter anaerophilus TaxID=877500 RepID=A0A4Q0XZK1_9BACT|nr:glutathione peroxidase [Halarcobacter anaerophilus]QDF29650.1 glutathione peroxidase [Halarcobacter anaerophilus]RXJ62575.1 glutathione peroxidase [Halarcobacter anaerophilus]
MNIYDFNVKDIDGNDVSMSKYKDKTLLIVNVASKCGFTSQYEELEELYETYKNKNFMVLGFPSNEFSNQEPGNEEEIKNFCSLTYNVQFDMFAKVEVNGKNEAPLYKYLKEEKTGILESKRIKWNFTKFLINKKGKVINRYAPITKPLSLKKDIENIL